MNLQKIWVRRCGRVNFTLKNVHSFTSICSLHFAPGEVLNVKANPTLVPIAAQPEAEALYQRKNPLPEILVNELPNARKEETKSSPKVYCNKRRKQAVTAVPVPIEVKVSTPTKIDVKPSHSTPVKIVFPDTKDADEPHPKKRRRGVENKNVQTDLCEDHVVQQLRAEVQHLKLQIKNMNSPSFVVNQSEEAGKFYTGLSQNHRTILWDFLGSEEDKKCLKLFQSSKTCGQLRLPIYDQFLLCLIKLKRGMTYKEMRFRFKIKSDLASKIVKTWLQFIFLTMKDMKDEMFVKKNDISRPLPKHFRCQLLRNVRVVIDCTEIFVESSTNYRQQGNIFSNYKHHATIKILIGVSPSGAAIFVSDGFEGSISDKAITQDSGFLDFIEERRRSPC